MEKLPPDIENPPLNIIACPGCGARVEETVPACPHCNRKISVEVPADIRHARHALLDEHTGAVQRREDKGA